MLGIIETQENAFGRLNQWIKAKVEPTGIVRVYDPIAGYWTTCHHLSLDAENRIRTLAEKTA